MSVKAKKGNITKEFSDLSWENLGENKNGWVEITGETSNISESKGIPATGEPEKKEPAQPNATTKNTAKKTEKKEDPTKEENAVTVDENPTASTTDSSESKDEEIAKFVEAKKAEFTDAAKEANITKNLIKDYFDNEENPVAYKASDSLDVLIGLLYDHLNGDVELLKSKFSV